jgi:Divergent InlB B-repeat domain
VPGVGLALFVVAVLASGAGLAPSAKAAASDPLTVLPTSKVTPSPLWGPCGLVVNNFGSFYVSDYYDDAIEAGSASFNAKAGVWEGAIGAPLVSVDALDGPCGLALDSTGRLYVNDFHRSVIRFGAGPSFGSGTALPLPSEDTEHHLPTGVSVDPATDEIYVDNRSYVSVYTSSGTPVMDGPDPRRIGVGTLGDGYGVAVSTFPGTYGDVYVPDAASNTVKVYRISASKTTPFATINGPSGKSFSSLRDSSVAVDRVSGDVYVVDDTQPAHTERPQATVDVYSFAGSYQGHLKFNVIDALPVGLAVDNSTHIEQRNNGESVPTQGRVYVTSGNTTGAGIYLYAPGAVSLGPPQPPVGDLFVVAAGAGAVRSASGSIDCADECRIETLAGESIRLTAVPDPGSEFTGWSGDGCSGTSPECVVLVGSAAAVKADFARSEPAGAGGPVAGEAAAAGVVPSRATHPRRSAARRGRGHASRRRGAHRHSTLRHRGPDRRARR